MIVVGILLACTVCLLFGYVAGHHDKLANERLNKAIEEFILKEHN